MAVASSGERHLRELRPIQGSIPARSKGPKMFTKLDQVTEEEGVTRFGVRSQAQPIGEEFEPDKNEEGLHE